MTHSEAKKTLQESAAHIDVDEDSGTAIINGKVTIEELQAILQLLEYNA
jgi:hypothetical protein